MITELRNIITELGNIITELGNNIEKLLPFTEVLRSLRRCYAVYAGVTEFIFSLGRYLTEVRKDA